MRASYVNGDKIFKERIREYLLLQEVYSSLLEKIEAWHQIKKSIYQYLTSHQRRYMYYWITEY